MNSSLQNTYQAISTTKSGVSYPPTPPPSEASPRTTPRPPLIIPRTFPRFTDLPPELRRRIYALSLPEPRLIPLVYHSPQQPYDGYHRHSKKLTVTSPLKPPSLLHAFPESRSYVQESYHLLFPRPSYRPHLYDYEPRAYPTEETKTYFSTDRDVLFFASEDRNPMEGMNFISICTASPKGDLEKVRWLAVNWKVFEREMGREFKLGFFWNGVREWFKGVEGVWFVGEGREEDVVGEAGRAIGEEGGDLEWGMGMVESGSIFRDERVAKDALVRSRAGDLGREGRRKRHKRRESFEVVCSRALTTVEREENWVGPRWKFLMEGEGR